MRLFKKFGLILAFLGLCFQSCSVNKESTAIQSKTPNLKNVYLDLDGSTINKQKLRSKEISSNFANISGITTTDTTRVHQLTVRHGRGQLTPDQLSQLQDNLQFTTKKYKSNSSIIVIDFYPGQDRCNSTGMASREDMFNYYNYYKTELKKLGITNQFNFYKSKEGLNRYNMNRKWIKDEDQVIESMFFPAHYLCSSFVAINSSGLYEYFYGEFHPEGKLEIIKQLKKINTSD